MAQLFKETFDPVEHPKRNGFDLSSRHVFSAKVGYILPVFKRMTTPGSNYQIDVKQLLRTLPISTAAFTRLGIHYDFYYTKINDFYTSFNQFIAQKQDKQIVNQPTHERLPYIELWKVVFSAFYVMLLNDVEEITSRVFSVSYSDEPSWAYILREIGLNEELIDDLGQFTQEGFSMASDVSEEYTFLAYSFTSQQDLHNSLGHSVIRMLDLLGYGNYLPYYSKFVYVLLKNHYGSLTPDKNLYTVREFNVTYQNGLTSLFSNGVNKPFASSQMRDLFALMLRDFENLKVSLFPIAAYNKVFEQHYRNSIYDNSFSILVYNADQGQFEDYNYDYCRLFNFDDLPVFACNATNSICDILSIFCVKLHQYQKDLFSGVLPSTQFGDVSILTPNPSFGTLQVSNSQDGSTNVVNASRLVNGSLASPTATPIASTANDVYYRIQQSIDVLSVRRAEALQRFNENMLRAGNRVRDNFRAHFGVSPNSEPFWDTTYCGSFSGSIDLNVVSSTTENNDVQLGQLGSNGVGVVNGDKIHVKASDFGYIIGCFYIDKPSEYDSFGIDRDLQLLDVFDYPYSELQNISLAPVDVITLNSIGSIPFYIGRSQSGEYDEFSQVHILGYLPRFIEHKTDYDKVHGEFFSSQPWQLSNSQDDFLRFPYLYYGDRLGVFSSFVTPRQTTTYTNSLAFLYVNASSVDNIFVQKFNNMQSSDQFQINCQFDCYSVSPLSVLGLPY